MPREFFIHSLYLLSAVCLTWFWTANPQLSVYNLQLMAAFILFYFLSHFLSKSGATTATIDAVIFTAVILLLVHTTGDLTSPVFFLIYFLLFAVALLFEPLISLTLTGALIAFFLQPTITPTMAIQLFSIVLILPLAIFVGRQYLKVLAAKDEIKILKKEGQRLTGHLTNEETHSLLWLTLNFKNGLLKIAHLSTDLLCGLGQLTYQQKEALEKINATAKELLKTGVELKEKLDKETD